MEHRRRFRSSCRCTRSVTFSSIFLFLSAILPASSFAQVGTDDPAQPSQPPSTIQTSTTSSPTTSSSPPTRIQTSPAASSTPITNDAKQPFNYYFLVVAIGAVFLCLGMLYLGRKRKQRLSVIRANRQRALAQDVWGLQDRFHRGRVGAAGVGGDTLTSNNRIRRMEGLDDRGEAPPPYLPGSKPPSLRSTEELPRPTSSQSSGCRRQEDLELGDMTRPGYEPPAYHDQSQNEGITRPQTAVTAQERLEPARRHLSHTENSPHG